MRGQAFAITGGWRDIVASCCRLVRAGNPEPADSVDRFTASASLVELLRDE
jgi:hypothetical protein